MNLQTIKQNFNEWMEECHEHILNLTNALEQTSNVPLANYLL
jgi:hypothetical protein